MFQNLSQLLLTAISVCALVVIVGCQTNKKLVTSFPTDVSSTPTLGDSFLTIANPAECDDLHPTDMSQLSESISPNALVDYQNISYTPISLAECIERALADSEVFRKLGGTIVSQPNSIETSLDPALAYTDPLAGEQAALSAFDTTVAASLFFENNDRPFNNRFSGNSDGVLVQDLAEYQLEFSKLAATGTLFTARQRINYDGNNQAGNRFPSAWETIIDAGFRHPLLQGSGTLFNRIAGPSQTPGQYSGVLIARTNTEISLAEFEQSTREFIANIENAYWDLYYAYRELEAQTDARDAAYEVFKRTKVLAEAQRIPGLEKASAEEQYLRFESAIIESMEGRTVDGTQANSGMTGGSFRRTVGVRVAERRLRYLVGLAITDGTLLQPSEIPSQNGIVFDWDQSVQAAVSRRPETRRQRWVLKQRELELTASRNFLKPRLDLVGNYRFRGLGKSLTGGGETLRDDIINDTQESGAFSDLAGGDYQEIQLGGEFRMPIGYRQANAGVRNAELGVQRARKVLEEQERKILLDLSNAIAETRRSHSAMDISKRRFKAAVEYRDQAAERVANNRSQMDVLLEAQRRILESQLQYINAEVEYTQAIKNVHFEKASYLQYHGIVLQESQSDPKAYQDAATRYSKRSSELSYVVRDAVIAQHIGETAGSLAMPMGAQTIGNGIPQNMDSMVPSTFEADVNAVMNPFDGVAPNEGGSNKIAPSIPAGIRPSVPVPGVQGQSILPEPPNAVSPLVSPKDAGSDTRSFVPGTLSPSAAVPIAGSLSSVSTSFGDGLTAQKSAGTQVNRLPEASTKVSRGSGNTSSLTTLGDSPAEVVRTASNSPSATSVDRKPMMGALSTIATTASTPTAQPIATSLSDSSAVKPVSHSVSNDGTTKSSSRRQK